MNEKVMHDMRVILNRIESKYPLSDKKVAPSFAKKLLHDFVQLIPPRFITSSRGHAVMRAIEHLLVRSTHGIPAQLLHAEIQRIGQLVSDMDIYSRDSEESIVRLERQLSDLRTLVTSPTDIEKRFRKLQEQLETLREGMSESQTIVADKQENMLEKFLTAGKKAFIVMPFQRDFDNVWVGGIKPACSDLHYVPLRVDEVNLSSLITDDIEKYSGMADVVIVDLTGNNPNVMFELGWALGKNKKPIVICQGEHASKVAFDVRGIRHISYENSWLGVEQLKKKIKEFISATEQQSDKKTSKKKPSKAEMSENKNK